MLQTPRRLLAFAVTTLLLVACSAPGGAGDPPPSGPPAGTPPGLLIADGTSFIHTFDLDGGAEWSQRLRYSAPWSSVTVVPTSNELLIATTSGSNPIFVKSYDIATFGAKDTLEWPESTFASTLLSLAATQDGAHLAMVISEGNYRYLEVIERATGSIVYTGLTIATGAQLVWTPDDRLLVPVDLSYEDQPSRWGAVVAFALADLDASTDSNVDGELIVTFTRAEWDTFGVDGLALSPDGAQLAYQRSGDLWVTDAQPGGVPHQLTTGPDSFRGPVFSPDGAHIAFVSGARFGLDETYVIPNHREPPLFIDHSQGAGDEYLLEANTLVDFMLAWLP